MKQCWNRMLVMSGKRNGSLGSRRAGEMVGESMNEAVLELNASDER